jgi:hypothetical protein
VLPSFIRPTRTGGDEHGHGNRARPHQDVRSKENGAVLYRQFRRDDEERGPNGNIQLNLHGLQLNVTTISSTQNRKQMMGIEHIALQTDNYASDIAKLRSNGAHVMLEQVSNGRHVAFIEAPDGAQMELIEKMA